MGNWVSRSRRNRSSSTRALRLTQMSRLSPRQRNDHDICAGASSLPRFRRPPKRNIYLLCPRTSLHRIHHSLLSECWNTILRRHRTTRLHTAARTEHSHTPQLPADIPRSRFTSTKQHSTNQFRRSDAKLHLRSDIRHIHPIRAMARSLQHHRYKRKSVPATLTQRFRGQVRTDYKCVLVWEYVQLDAISHRGTVQLYARLG